MRRALYDRLSGPRRAELHLRVGEALEAGGGRSGRALADLAHHFAAAAPFGPAERAVEYNLLAARAAGAALAFDEAAARLRTALELGGDDRPEVFLELGRARHRAGASVDALDAFRRAAALARERGDAQLLAHAAIGHEEACWRPGMTDQGAVALLEEAAAALGPTTPSCASACSPAWRARSTCRACASAGASRARARSRWRAGSTTAPGWPPC